MGQLIILGNGFDLSVGLQTSYNDFFYFLVKEYGEVQIDNLLEDSIPLSQSQELSQGKKNEWSDNFDFWSVWFLVLKRINCFKKTYVEWSDVETQIKNVLVHLCKYNRQGDNYNLILEEVTKKIKLEKNQNEWLDNYEKALDFYFKGWLIYLGVNSKINNYKIDVYDLLFENLKEFERKFALYLCKKVMSPENISNLLGGKHNALYKRRSLLKKLRTLDSNEIEKTQILCFNYTPVFDPRFTEEDKDKHIGENVRYIHGSIKVDNKENKFVPGKPTQIIFGIDDTKLNFENDDENVAESIYRFGKTYRIMNLSNEFSLDLNKEIETIKFYGHSLNEADYAYFQSIFDKVNLYGSNVKLLFYYGNYENNNNEHMKAFMDRIYRLIETYGQNTFRNASAVRGKNLLHKLLLEGRIKTKYISVDNL